VSEETQPDTAPEEDRGAWAPWWHTVLLIAFILFTSYGSSLHTKQSGAAAAQIPKAAQYIGNIGMQWLVVAFVWWGLYLRKRTLGQVIGRKWQRFEDALLDFAVAVGFWLASGLALYGIQKLLGIASNEALKQRLRGLQFITPKTGRELALFVCLAATAGICEEIIFRGYLQRQFICATHNTIAGIAASAALFGLAHGYQGGKMMIVLGCYGAMFGTLAHFRRSLLPGMIAHAGQDSLVGVLLFVMSRSSSLK